MSANGGTGAGPAVRMWARSELSRRWRALVVLGVIAGLAAGLGMAGAAGARRTATAYDRWRTATNAPDAIVFGTQVASLQNEKDILAINYDPVLALPEVIDGGTFTLAPVGVPKPELGQGLQPGDDHLYRTLSRPLLVSGRIPDPSRADEMFVNREAAAKFHLHTGQKLTVVSSIHLEAWDSSNPQMDGPTEHATIVGIGDSMIDLIFSQGQPGFTVSGGFLAKYKEVPRAKNLVVRLKPGTDGNAFRVAAAKAMGLPDVPIRDLRDDQKRITRGTDLERTSLWLFTAAVLLAGIVLVGQALTRTVYTMAESSPGLRALGFTRPNLIVGLLLPTIVTVATTVVVAIVTAVVLSSRFPVGLARRLDPDVGMHADWTVLLPGAAVVALVIVAGAAYAAWRAAVASERSAPAPSSSRTMRAIRNRLPLPAAIGAGLALQGGRGDKALPVRPAIAGAVAGVLGIVGALGLVHGIDDALAVPARSGQVWDVLAHVDEEHPVDAMAKALSTDREVTKAAYANRVNLDVGGAGLPVYTMDSVKGGMSFVVLHGRAPKAPDEIALGPASLKALHHKIGGHLAVANESGISSDFKIVGSVLLGQTAHSSFDQGAWITPPAFDKLVPPVDEQGDPSLVGEPVVAITGRPGVKPEALGEHLQKTLGVDGEGAEVPQDVVFLKNVRNLPRGLAAFLVVLGVAAVGHALIMTVRRRRHDLAVLRAMGLRPRQSAACILWQAMTVAVVALIIGIPIGIVIGRLSWRWVADTTPLLYVAPVAVLAIIVAIPAAIAMANMLAVYPAAQASGVRPAEVLRTE